MFVQLHTLHVEQIFGGSKIYSSVCFEYYLHFIFACHRPLFMNSYISMELTEILVLAISNVSEHTNSKAG